jgi:hypothetical protein
VPVEIKELIIRAVVEDERKPRQEAAEASTSSDDKAAIVEACVKQVLRILKKHKER